MRTGDPEPTKINRNQLAIMWGNTRNDQAGPTAKVSLKGELCEHGELAAHETSNHRRRTLSIQHVKTALRAFAIASAFALAAPGEAVAQEESLYKRVGGYDVIAVVAADFTKGLGGDPVLKPYFFARSDDSRRRILQMFRELLCAEAGGPCLYVGRDMKTAHVGLKMGETEWTALMKLWGEILDRHKLEGRNKDGMIEIFAKYKGDILGASGAR